MGRAPRPGPAGGPPRYRDRGQRGRVPQHLPHGDRGGPRTLPGCRPVTSAGRGPLLAIDTATSQIVVALERPGGRAEVAAWPAGQRHGEELLTALDGLLQRLAVRLDMLGGIVVGTGPGAFTGLRVGLATAKGLAQALAIPIIGIPTSAALLAPVSVADSDLPPDVA